MNAITKKWRKESDLYVLQCTDDDKRCYRSVCNMSLISFSLTVIFIIRLF